MKHCKIIWYYFRVSLYWSLGAETISSKLGHNFLVMVYAPRLSNYALHSFWRVAPIYMHSYESCTNLPYVIIIMILLVGIEGQNSFVEHRNCFNA
jgi:hypothetical protein